MLTQSEINKFKDITQKVYGLKLTDEQAKEQGERLLSIIDLMGKTLNNSELNRQLPVDRRKHKR